MRLFVKGLTGGTLVVLAQPSWDVMDLKQHIEHAKGMPPDEQRLIFAGRQLEDSITLANCHVQQDSTLHLVSRSRGD